VKRVFVNVTIALFALFVLACSIFVIVASFASGVGAQEPPRLYVVSSRSEVYPGQLFTVTITQFGQDAPITFDAGGLEVISTDQRGQTLYVTLRAGAPGDVQVRARAGALSAGATIRVCCKREAHRVYLPWAAHTGAAQRTYLPAIKSP
jgi:hypothetical protein